ncbi:ras-related protein Rab-9B isoform X4 [Symphalangus syndactylus]|uniref:ras-related protein Rab-9B isoform X4 n=1 Tax=Symphalangus syndactylus TaxID=9590 RepID=UPI003004BED3
MGAAVAALGTALPRLGYPSLGDLAKHSLSRAAPGRLSAQEAPAILFPCRATGTRRRNRAVDAGAYAAHQWSTGKERARDCPARRGVGEAPPGLGGARLGESVTARQGMEHSHGLVALRKELWLIWMLPTGSSKPNPNLNSVRLIAELVGRRFPGGNS